MTRMAYFTPLDPQPSGVSDYSEALLPYLASRMDIDVFVDEAVAAAPRAAAPYRVLAHTRFARCRRKTPYDAVVYQMGNSPFHRHVVEWLVRYPGITVLHDVVLHHFHRERTLEYGDTAGYLRELAYSGGVAGARRAAAVMRGRAPIPLYAMPLFERVVDASAVVMVHSSYAARQISRSRPQARIVTAPLLCDPRALAADPARTAQLRQRWQIAPDAFVVAAFGRLDAQRRVDALLRAFDRLRAGHPTAVCLLVGEPVPLYDLRGLVEHSPCRDAVRVTGRVSLEDFYAAFDLADAAVNLRDPTAGETSAVTVQLLGRGVPLVVSDAGWYAELPDRAVLKVATGPLEVAQLTRALESLAGSAALRAELRAAARQFVSERHSPERAVEAYLTAMEQAHERRRARGAI